MTHFQLGVIGIDFGRLNRLLDVFNGALECQAGIGGKGGQTT